MHFVRCDQTPAWAQLKDHHASEDWDIRAAFARDPQRAEHFSPSAAGVGVDFSKMPIHTDTEKLLHTLAQDCGVAELRDAMFAGEAINTTEQRQVMHWMLRQPARSLGGSLAQPLAQVHETLDAMLAMPSKCGPTCRSPMWFTWALADRIWGRSWWWGLCTNPL